MNPVEEFAANLQTEDMILSKPEQETETSDDSPSETKPEEEQSPSHQGDKEQETASNTDSVEEKDVPFHKHPRFKEVIEEKNRLKAQLEELQGSVNQRFSAIESTGKQAEHIPQWFSRIHGDDQDAWREYQTYEQDKLRQVKESIYQEQEMQKKQQEENVKKWEDYTSREVERLKEEGKSFDKNELMKTLLEYQPTNKQGYLDFDKAYEILEMKKRVDSNPEKSRARKEIAASTTSSPAKGEAPAKDYISTNDLRGKNIFDLIH